MTPEGFYLEPLPCKNDGLCSEDNLIFDEKITDILKGRYALVFGVLTFGKLLS